MSCTEFNLKAKEHTIDMYIPLLDAVGNTVNADSLSGRVRFSKQNGTIVYVAIGIVVDNELSAEITRDGKLRCVIPASFQDIGDLEVAIEADFKSQITTGASVFLNGYRSNTIKLINFYE